jgi:hypothetical protein
MSISWDIDFESSASLEELTNAVNDALMPKEPLRIQAPTSGEAHPMISIGAIESGQVWLSHPDANYSEPGDRPTWSVKHYYRSPLPPERARADQSAPLSVSEFYAQGDAVARRIMRTLGERLGVRMTLLRNGQTKIDAFP